MKNKIEEAIRAAYHWGRDNGEQKSEKNLNDFFETSIAKEVLSNDERTYSWEDLYRLRCFIEAQRSIIVKMHEETDLPTIKSMLSVMGNMLTDIMDDITNMLEEKTN